MRDTFYEYFQLPDVVKDNIWKDGLIVLDTNVLLDLYRLPDESRDDFISVLKHYQDRAWIPYQVGWEFYNNREKVIESVCESDFEQLEKDLDRYKDTTLNLFSSFKKHPTIDRSYFEKEVNRTVKAIQKKQKEWKEKVHDYSESDPVLDFVNDFFDKRVGEDYDLSQLQDIYKQGRIRYSAKVPPGYKDDTSDKKAQGERHLYGDFIVWRQIIDKAKSDKKDIVFITNDNKEDWWEVDKGEAVMPRYELLKEFYKETGKDIIMFRMQGFLNEAKSRDAVKVKKDTVADAGTFDLNPFYIANKAWDIDYDKVSQIIGVRKQEFDKIYDKIRSLNLLTPRTDVLREFTKSLYLDESAEDD